MTASQSILPPAIVSFNGALPVLRSGVCGAPSGAATPAGRLAFGGSPRVCVAALWGALSRFCASKTERLTMARRTASLGTLLGHSLVGGVVYNAVLCTIPPH